jgi:alpha-glucosidase
MRKGLLAVLFVVLLATPGSPGAEVRREIFTAGNRYLVVEALDDDLLHFELSAVGSPPDAGRPVPVSPMIARTDQSGPAQYRRDGMTVETGALRAEIAAGTLCVAVTDAGRRPLTTICPLDLDQPLKGLTLTREGTTQVYGLGQQFKALGSADGDWLQHRVRLGQPPGQEQGHGNGFMPFGPAGLVGNVQFPIMYAAGADVSYALLLDNVYRQQWDFGGDPWRVQMWGDQIRFYVLGGPDLLDLRRDYLELVGRPPVPPRKAFGLWVSEFGYTSWQQVNALREGLRRDGFPLDGFVLDLQWFGGIRPGSPDSPMGRLDWDQDRNDGNSFWFPDPEQNLAFLAGDGVGIVTIEESYIARHTDTFGLMHAGGHLLAYRRQPDGRCDPSRQGDPVILHEWFGQAGMVDWSDPAAGRFVHDQRRHPNLVTKGVLGHWTDLGEPEKYDPGACYEGVETTAAGLKNEHGDLHNLYNFLWNRSIYEGYRRHSAVVARRPFIMTRSGAPGTQRFGAAMWSGDIGADLGLLATHLNAQMHMSFSGIDYYGADIGGFRREGLPYNREHAGHLQYQDELYTQWFASGAWFDVPVRPHTDNSFQSSLRYETSPNLVGNRRANLASIRQRYELIPYYYSLAYRAHLLGEPVIAPMVIHYQDDPVVRGLGHQKLVGRDLLVGVVARHGEYQRDVYLPRGRWANYHTDEWVTSQGTWLRGFPVYLDGVFRLPAFARAGAIIPGMIADGDTRDAFGHRRDGSAREDLVVRVYADAAETRFTLYEDDGTTLGFDSQGAPVYRTRTTELSQRLDPGRATVVVGAARGSYPGATDRRRTLVRLAVENAAASAVRVNGVELPRLDSRQAFDAAEQGWYDAGGQVVLARSGSRPVDQEHRFEFTLAPTPPTASVHFVCDRAWTNLGEEVHVAGSVPELGGWDPARAVRLEPNVYFAYIYNPPPGHQGPGPDTPKWTGLVRGLPGLTTIEWKCVRRAASGQLHWEPGPNNTVTTGPSGFAGSSLGEF